jgi:hypothetical protein
MRESPTLEQLQILDLLIGEASIRVVDSLLQPWAEGKTMMEYWLSDNVTAAYLIWLLREKPRDNLMSMSDYQYERLCYLLKYQELSLSELQMLYDILSHDWASEDRVVQWLLSWLRKKPVKDTRR